MMFKPLNIPCSPYLLLPASYSGTDPGGGWELATHHELYSL